MPSAFILCPSTIIDMMRFDDGSRNIYKKFLELATSEKNKVCTLESKKFRHFIPVPVHDRIIDFIVENYMNSKNKETFEIEMEYIKMIHSVFEREGSALIDLEPFESTIELARELNDKYDVFIVTEYTEKVTEAFERIRKELIEKIKKSENKTFKFSIISLKEAIRLMNNNISELNSKPSLSS